MNEGDVDIFPNRVMGRKRVEIMFSVIYLFYAFRLSSSLNFKPIWTLNRYSTCVKIKKRLNKNVKAYNKLFEENIISSSSECVDRGFVDNNAISNLFEEDETQINYEDRNDLSFQIANRESFQKMSEESKLIAGLAMRRKNKLITRVQETGRDTMSSYLKSMSNHELLRKEDELILGREIQKLMKYEEKRQELEESLLRAPTFLEWAEALNTTVSDVTKQIHRSQRAKTTLMESNLRLVVSVAKQYMKQGRSEINFQDVCQEAIIGLNKACEKFDPEQGFKFSTYAYWWIKRQVKQNIADQARSSFVLPYHIITKINQIKIAEVTLKGFSQGRMPSDEKLADKLDITVEKLQYYRKISQDAFSLDKQFTAQNLKGSNASIGASNKQFTLGDTVRDPELTPSEIAVKQTLRHDVSRLIKTLTPREQAVIRLRFGLDDGNQNSLKQIAARFKVSIQKIKNIEQKALRKLKQPYRNQSLKYHVSDL